MSQSSAAPDATDTNTAGQPPSTPWTGWWRWVPAVAAGWVVIAYVPLPWLALGTGLDYSYVWALNVCAERGLVHGRDVIYTFGPLGYLLVPMDVGSNLLKSSLAEAVMMLLLGWGLLRLFRLTTTRWTLGAAVAALLFAQGLSLPVEYLVVLVAAVLVTAAVVDPSGSLVGAAVAGAWIGVLPFVKLSAGVGGLAMVTLAEVGRLATRGRRALPATVTTLASFVITAGLLAAVLFPAPAVLWRWLNLAREIASGYDGAMSLGGPTTVLVLGELVLVVLVGLLACWRRDSSDARLVALVLMVPVLLAFKHGFVRQATHTHNFFPVVVALTALLLLVAQTPRARFQAAAAVTAVAVAAVIWSLQGGSRPNGFQLARATGRSGARNLVHLLAPAGLRQELAEQGERQILPDRLPQQWLDLIRSSGASVDVVPNELAIIPTNGLRWSPNPVLQTFCAYTPKLDNLSAEHFTGPSAPGFVILELVTIDLRHPLLDAPATGRALLQWYDPIATAADPPRLLLRRRLAPAAPGVTVGRRRLILGEWTPVPYAPGLVLAEIDLEPTWAGRLQRLLFKVRTVGVELLLEDGTVVPVRIVPATTGHGILVSHWLGSPTQMVKALAGRPGSRVVRFRMAGSGTESYRADAELRWVVLPFPGVGR